MSQRASVFCNFYIRVDREALVSERAWDVGSVAFKAMSTKNDLHLVTFEIFAHVNFPVQLYFFFLKCRTISSVNKCHQSN
jgi:hypothetical protein